MLQVGFVIDWGYSVKLNNTLKAAKDKAEVYIKALRHALVLNSK